MSLIKTIRANCKDCYKCVRHCPMKAIRVVDGHAEVIDELCIGDGTCVCICPQSAKQVRDSREDVRAILASGKKVALSVAPSFVASFSDVDSGAFATAARRLGFDVVAETAEAAYYVTEQTVEALDRCERPAIATSCPVIVNLVERYYPHLLSHLVPVASPMVAHGRMLKEALGPDSRVVFVGPCIAKKREAEREEAAGAVDAVLTFAELSDLFEDAGIIPSSQEHGEWDGHVPGVARLFPVEGGMMATAGISGSFMEGADLCITGIDQSIDFLEHVGAHEDIRLVEMLSCEGGCIAGPCMLSDLDLWSRRRRIVEHAARGRAGSVADLERSGEEPGKTGSPRPEMLSMSFHARKIDQPMPTEDEILEILAQTDKFCPEDELNCGACGYNSCREKAIAVYRGMAEVEMCIPYMRRRAESMSNLIISSTPNAIVAVDRDFNIVLVNPSFESVFRISAESCVGQHVGVVMDPEPFRKVFETRKLMCIEEEHLDGELRTSQIVFYVEVRDLVVAIGTDITAEHNTARAIQKAREETLEKAGAVIDRQMRVAQEIAGLLGETTAETKVLLTQLMKQMQDEELTRR